MSTPRPEQGASTRTRSKPSSSAGSSSASAFTTVRAAPSRAAFSSSSRARPGCFSTATTSAPAAASCVAFPPGAAQRSSTRSPGCAPTAFPASCEPRLCGHGSLRPPVGSRRTRSGGSFCARIRASASSAPHSRHHVSAIQSGYECLSAGLLRRRLGKPSEELADSLSQPPHDGVRERHGALESRGAHELDALVRGRVRRDRVEVAELVARRGAARRAQEGRASARAGGRASRSRGRAYGRAAPSRRRPALRRPGRARRGSPPGSGTRGPRRRPPRRPAGRPRMRRRAQLSVCRVGTPRRSCACRPPAAPRGARARLQRGASPRGRGAPSRRAGAARRRARGRRCAAKARGSG